MWYTAQGWITARPLAPSDEGAVVQRGPRAARLPRGERRSHVVFELWGLPRSETYNVCSDETEGETEAIQAWCISPSVAASPRHLPRQREALVRQSSKFRQPPWLPLGGAGSAER